MRAARPARAGETRTVAFLVAANSSAPGCGPAINGSWYQDVPLVEITAAGQPAARDRRRPGAASAFDYRTDFVGALLSRPASASQIADGEIVFIGLASMSPRHSWKRLEGMTCAARPSSSWSRSGLADSGAQGPFNGER